MNCGAMITKLDEFSDIMNAGGAMQHAPAAGMCAQNGTGLSHVALDNSASVVDTLHSNNNNSTFLDSLAHTAPDNAPQQLPAASDVSNVVTQAKCDEQTPLVDS